MPKKSVPALRGRTIRCILFDLGYTLWSYKDAATRQRLENAANVRAALLLRPFLASSKSAWRDLSDEVVGKRLHELVDERMHVLLRQTPGREPDFGLVVRQALEQQGIEGVGEMDYASAAAMFEALRVRIPESRPLFDDVLPTLAALRERGFLLGVVTNRHWGGPLFQEDLQTLGLLEYIDPRHMAISADIGVRKPDPAIFLHALNALQTPPEQAAMVGDSLISDIGGSKQLGIFSVWKPKPAIQAQTAWGRQLVGDVKPDLIIGHLSELLDIFMQAGEQ